jgi:hypothetical protein
MRRREFITLLGNAAVAWPVAARAAESMPESASSAADRPAKSAGVVAAFRQGLREAGFVEGHLKTAKPSKSARSAPQALGLDVPIGLSAAADELIE